MKRLPYYLLILMSYIAISCSNENLDDTAPVVEVENPDPDPNSVPDPDIPPNVVTTPCSSDILSNVAADATIIFNCVLDLDGKTITLPSNVKFEFDGGDIKNGKLVFDGGTIAGELLNSNLEIEGDVKLKKPTFNFFASRWGIAEGKVSDQVAKNNKDIFQNVIYKVKELQGDTFNVDKLDAFFKVDKPLAEATAREAAINIPGDYNLIMTDNTHLRMQPNGNVRPLLLTVTDGNSNVVIKGGILHGERDQHDYNSPGSHEWPTLLSLASCNTVLVDGVTFMDATGDGMSINATSHAHSPNYNPARNLIVTKCKFLRNRRNSLSITDGHHITIEDNEFIDAGIHTASSQGTAPGFAIDVEAARGSGPQPNQVVEDIIIRNNIEKGSRVGGFTVHTGDRVTIEGNQMENLISYSTTIGTIIRNNTITSTTDKTADNGTAITAGRNDRYERNYGNKVYGNTITGFSTGIKTANTDLKVYSNEIIDCKVGISIEILTNSEIYENTIRSSKETSNGIVSAGLSEYINNVTIRNNNIDVKRTSFIFVDINNNSGQENYKLVIRDNISTSTTLSNTNGVDFIGNTIDQSSIRLVKAKNSNVSSNKISASNSHGIRLDTGCKNIQIASNNISVSGNFNCIEQTTTDGLNISIGNDNTCNN
ncbi:Right handed beta helix region [Aquimarina sp. MAR_2010_214]|uniref:right-handed parallel beta-helix repeat-containing protein n=1 Tax=Aquimarina sp. MAR_2010_214 TaxID=1250026 RepID=UPI000C6FF9B4|nr:right-handed parallel beta-helix repeat-containing protein [Aquimarina sp. MAR_2010_214]PKV50985.1 Right handed beta helix region [Aquimarina sp. MAR_2010_214]